MKSKIKTSILIDEELWKRFKLKANAEEGLKGISKAVEEALEEELAELMVADALKSMAPSSLKTLDVKPVKPAVKTSAGRVIREMRDSAA